MSSKKTVSTNRGIRTNYHKFETYQQTKRGLLYFHPKKKCRERLNSHSTFQFKNIFFHQIYSEWCLLRCTKFYRNFNCCLVQHNQTKHAEFVFKRLQPVDSQKLKVSVQVIRFVC